LADGGNADSKKAARDMSDHIIILTSSIVAVDDANAFLIRLLKEQRTNGS